MNRATPGAQPDFVIIGAQKSGSSALMAQLAAHPAVYLPKDETRYFRDPWFQFEDAAVLRAAVAPGGPEVTRRGIKCPDLLAGPEAPERIRDELGPVELIAVLREPVSRAISAYYWYMQWGWLPIAPPEAGLRKLLHGDYAASYPRSAEILQQGRYGEQVRRFLEVFPREKLHVLLTDDLRADPNGSITGVYEFLGVDPTGPALPSGRNVNTGVYSPRRLRFLRLRHRWIMRSFPGFEGTYRQEPSSPLGWLIDRSVAAIDRLVLARLTDNTQPPVSAQLRAELADHYRADVALLAETLGRDLSAWSGASASKGRS